MSDFNAHLIDSVRAGFIDASIPSNLDYGPQLLLNDVSGGTKVLSTIHKSLKECQEYWFSVAFVSKSGVAAIMNVLHELDSTETKGKILVSQYLNFTQPEALRTLLQFKNIDLRIVTKGNFHGKTYTFKNGSCYNLIIGSSNLTAAALSVNKEWNLKISATENSSIIDSAIREFKNEFENAELVNHSFLSNYQLLYNEQRRALEQVQQLSSALPQTKIVPNSMQVQALSNLKKLRAEGGSRAILISATGTGKTYLSAFDVKYVNPKRFLFVVHRLNIAKAALKSFQNVIGSDVTMGIYSGNRRELNSDYIFTTIQTISKDQHLLKFPTNYFDYIVVDETHRVGADSYQKILSHFTPKFLLGMTATPERTDGYNIFKEFDHNIAFEIRLHKALEENILSTFHYFGVSEVIVNGSEISENSAFNLLTSKERVDRIIEKAKFYGTDSGIIRGLIFCSRKDEAATLSEMFNSRGFNTMALTGDDDENRRNLAIEKIQSDESDKLDYIFTVDIFNEGIDIPKVNQIILLRPTQSAIVFVQQLGRGLRKADGKEFLTVIDFIGNYANNYMVPIALFGDNTYNKDRLRKLLYSGSNLIPGASTVNFDSIARERIFSAINSANLSLAAHLNNDYQLLQFQLGRPPMMTDFIEHNSRNPYLFVQQAGSFYKYVSKKEDELKNSISGEEEAVLELFSRFVLDGKRIEEVIILSTLINNRDKNSSELKIELNKTLKGLSDDSTFKSALQNLNGEFINNPKNIVQYDKEVIRLSPRFNEMLANPTFKFFLDDLLNAAKLTYEAAFNASRFIKGFMLYEKYTRRDVLRILNFPVNMPGQNVAGYVVSKDKTSCPLFVTYKKKDDIHEGIQYEDVFLDKSTFQWNSKMGRSLQSPEIVLMSGMQENAFRVPLFIQKSNDEGKDFYYMGDVIPQQGHITQEIRLVNGNQRNIVKVIFDMTVPVEDSLYDYITS